MKFVDDPILIHKRTYDLLARLSSKVVNGRMYANRFLRISRKIKIFGTIECTKDLSNIDCEECLDIARNELRNCSYKSLVLSPLVLLFLHSVMATASVAFKSREDHRKQIELEEARKAGLAPAEVDEDGKEINPHIPQYMSSAPWYLNAERPSLKHQRKWKSDPNYTKSWYDRGAKIYHADKYRKGACENCGAMTHSAKSCMERPRKKGAKWTNFHIAPDEKIEMFELDYDGKRDRWNGFDAATYARVIERYEARDEARRKYLKEQQLKKLEEKNNKQNGEGEVSDDDEDNDALKVDEAKVDESKQMDFAKVEKRVRTTGGGSTGTVRNLRIREDTAKYLLNLDVNSAYYDPKTRSMREDPLPDADPNEKFYGGDNQYRVSGQALEFKKLNIHAWEAFEKGQDIHMQAAPSQAELLYKNFKVIKDKLKSQMKDAIMEKYGNAATEEVLPKGASFGTK
ncbi:hypothetical protein GBA52_005267 [Prunus armeniaca]|nr:hypothetical protein GBA52_005267 [Prunus armeniaca]